MPPDKSGAAGSVVELTYRCRIDRLAISTRRWCLSASARHRLRYAIAGFASFRSVELSEQLESAIGREITDVHIDKAPASRSSSTQRGTAFERQ
ncbi:MAG: hypothetical protein WA797_08735 [Acidimicrobiales bacterium]